MAHEQRLLKLRARNACDCQIQIDLRFANGRRFFAVPVGGGCPGLAAACPDVEACASIPLKWIHSLRQAAWGKGVAEEDVLHGVRRVPRK